MAPDPRGMRGSLKPDVRFEGTRPSDITGYPPTERELVGTQPSKLARYPQSGSAFREYTTLGACAIASNQTYIPIVHDPRGMQDGLQVRMQSWGTQRQSMRESSKPNVRT